jgi:hypothetical protein
MRVSPWRTSSWRCLIAAAARPGAPQHIWTRPPRRCRRAGRALRCGSDCRALVASPHEAAQRLSGRAAGRRSAHPWQRSRSRRRSSQAPGACGVRPWRPTVYVSPWDALHLESPESRLARTYLLKRFKQSWFFLLLEGYLAWRWPRRGSASHRKCETAILLSTAFLSISGHLGRSTLLLYHQNAYLESIFDLRRAIATCPGPAMDSVAERLV